MKAWKIGLCAMMAACTPVTHAAGETLNLCVYDPLGTAGDLFGYAKDYVLQMPRFGLVNPVNLKAYINEGALVTDFKAGRCDGAMMSTLRAREFNQFTGSLDAFGAVPSKRELNIILQVLSNKQFGPKMSEGPYEVVGMLPLGSVYIMTNNRQDYTIARMAKKKIAVLDFDKAQAEFVQRQGGIPVSVDYNTAYSKFNTHQVDVLASPAIMFRPLELWRGLTDSSGAVKGAMIRLPVIQLTGTLIVHKNKFPNEDVNQKIREYVFSQIGFAYKYIDSAEKEIDNKYWIDVPDPEKQNYVRFLHDSRVAMVKGGVYNADMMHLVKKVRCKVDPTSYACAQNDE